MRLLISGLVMSLALAAGCKKDEPAAEAAKAAEQAGKTVEGAAKAAIEGAKGPAADKPAARAAQAAVKAVAPKKVEMPADVVAVGHIQGFDKLFTTVETKAKAYGVPLPLTKDAILQQGQAALGLKNMDWFDGEKAIKVVIWNPKKHSDSVLLFVPTKGADKLTAALPDAVEKDVEGNAFVLNAMGEKVYVNPAGDYAIITSKPKIFADAKADALAVTKSFEGKGVWQMVAHTGHLRAIFKDELGDMRKQLKDLKPMLTKELEKEAGMAGLAGMDKVIDFYMSLLDTVIDESETVEMSIDLDDKGNITSPVAVTAKKGGKIATLAGKLASADLTYSQGAPANAYMVVGGHVDPTAFDGMMQYSADLVGALLKLNDADKKKLLDQIGQLMKLQDGKTWTAIYADGKFPLAFAGAAGTKDGAAYKKLFGDYMTLVLTQLLATASDVLPPTLQNLPTDNFAKLIETLNAMTAPMGVKMAATSKKNGDVTVDALTISVDVETVSKLAGGPGATAEIKKVTDMLGTKVEMAMAYGPKNIGMGFGPNGIRAASDAASNKGKDSAKLVERFNAGTAVFMHLDVARTLGAWKPVAELAGEGKDFPSFPAGSSLGFSMGAAENTLTMESYGTLDKFVQAGMKIMQGKDKAAPAPAPAP